MTVSLARRVRPVSLCLAALLLLLAACKDEAAPEPTPTLDLSGERVVVETSVSTAYYDVEGATTEAIFSFVERNGPTDGEGKRGSGLTSVTWGYEWQGMRSGDSCAIRSMTIRADIVVTLPRHANEAALDPAIRAHWQRYAEGVAAHEQRHVDIYRDGALKLKTLMQQIPALDSCGLLEGEIGRIWSEQQDSINRAQAAFHEEEALRLAAQRQPLAARIEQNRASLASLQSRIAALDQQLRSLRAEIDDLDKQIDDVDAQIEKVEDSNQPPADKQAQLVVLIQHRNALVTRHNAAVDDHNAALTQRDQLASQHAATLAETNQLVEDYNWAR